MEVSRVVSMKTTVRWYVPPSPTPITGLPPPFLPSSSDLAAGDPTGGSSEQAPTSRDETIDKVSLLNKEIARPSGLGPRGRAPDTQTSLRTAEARQIFRKRFPITSKAVHVRRPRSTPKPRQATERLAPP